MTSGLIAKKGAIRFFAEYLKTLVSELRDLSPVFVAPTSEISLSVSGSDKVSTRLKEHDGAVWLIAANRDALEATVTFEVPFSLRRVTVVNEDRSITPDGRAFIDRFGKYGVHVYRIER